MTLAYDGIYQASNMIWDIWVWPEIGGFYHILSPNMAKNVNVNVNPDNSK